jgi:ABC-type polysaccharide/polyol phosphate export permease
MTTLEKPRLIGVDSPPERPSGHDQIRVVRAEDGAPGLRAGLAELWRYRELLISMVVRELRVRYRQSTLGPAWALLQPLALMIVFSLFLGRFAHIPSGGVPYPIFYYAALAPWTFVAAVLPAATISLLSNAALINKVYVPREIFPIVGVVVAAADFGCACTVLAVMMVWFHTPVTPCLLALPVLFLGQLLLCLGLALFLAAVCVHVRDIRHAVPVLTQVWMYATPVVYSLECVPRRLLLPYMLLNPLAAFMDGYRRVILHGQPPQWGFVALATAVSGLLFLGSYRLFKILERRCADTL